VTVKPPSGSSTYWRHGPTTSPLLSTPPGTCRAASAEVRT
jgi:hypothetical protein